MSGTECDIWCLNRYMLRHWLQLSFFVAMTGALVLATNAQVTSKEERERLFAQLAEDDKAVAVCAKAAREEQMKKFGRPLPRVSGHCFSGCPTRLPKPHYPEIARKANISGEVVVDTIVDEEGKVVFAKAKKGNRLLRAAAVQAANLSQYQPKITCGNRRIKFRWTIRYNFYPTM